MKKENILLSAILLFLRLRNSSLPGYKILNEITRLKAHFDLWIRMQQ